MVLVVGPPKTCSGETVGPVTGDNASRGSSINSKDLYSWVRCSAHRARGSIFLAARVIPWPARGGRLLEGEAQTAPNRPALLFGLSAMTCHAAAVRLMAPTVGSRTSRGTSASNAELTDFVRSSDKLCLHVSPAQSVGVLHSFSGTAYRLKFKQCHKINRMNDTRFKQIIFYVLSKSFAIRDDFEGDSLIVNSELLQSFYYDQSFELVAGIISFARCSCSTPAVNRVH